MTRDNFGETIKRKLAQRAGYQCSICGRITVGPSAERLEGVNLTGQAAHIAAAARGGRRFDESQSPSERSDISNGIWLCSYHADLVDGDDKTYRTDLLKQIKANHEAKIALQLNGISVDRGLVTEVDLSNFGEVSNNINLKFSNRNAIFGDNGVGKTLICEFIAALVNKQYLERWHKDDNDDSNGYCSIKFFRNELTNFTIAISADNNITYSINDAEVPLLVVPMTVFYLSEDIHSFRHRINRIREENGAQPIDKNDLITWLAMYFKLTVQEFINVVNSMKKAKKFFINDLNVNQAENEIEVRYGSRRKEGFHSFWRFSSGEQQRIILEIALKIATYYAKFQTTILLLENSSIDIVDYAGINRLLDIIRTEDLGFQFFFTSSYSPAKFRLDEYTVYELRRSSPNGPVISSQIIKN